MKHATRAEASAARLAALKASREKRTYAKHVRWAQEMRATGHWIVMPTDGSVIDAEGAIWRRCPDGMYRMDGDMRYAPRTLTYIQDVYGLAGDS